MAFYGNLDISLSVFRLIMILPIRILLADDHALLREVLKLMIERVDDMRVEAEAANGEEVLLALDGQTFDVLLLDLTMPGLCGHELIERLCLREAPPILVLSMHDNPAIVRRALAAGARGYLTKDNSPEILLTAIRKVAAGGRYIDPVLAQALVFDELPEVGGELPHTGLSEREFEIFSLLARGRSVNEIADLLYISNKTVSTHKSRLMEKMAFACNADLVRYALQHRLLD